MKYDVVMKQFKQNTLRVRLLLSNFSERPYLYGYINKNINTGLYSGTYRLISFKCGMMIETLGTTFLYQFGWPWPSLKVTVVWEIRNFGIHFLTNLSIDFNEIQYVATTFWFVQGYAKKILLIEYSRERILLTWFYKIYV